MNRLMVGVASGVAAVLAAPIAAIIGLEVWQQDMCDDGVKELERVREAVAADLTALHSTPMEMWDVCDSGDSPYLDTRLKPSVQPEQATRLLETKGWRVVGTYRRSDGSVWSWELRKQFRAKSVHLSIVRPQGVNAARISVGVD